MSSTPARRWSVHPATADDLEALVRFNQAMALETEDRSLPLERLRAGVNHLLHHPDLGYYLLARPMGDAAAPAVGGLAVTFEWSDWRNGCFWWIQSVYVEPGARRQGVFGALYSAVEGAARSSEGVCGLRLYVESENRGAQATYEALGMVRPAYELYEVDFTEA